MKLKGTPALGAAAPSHKLDIESVKITMILKIFEACVARMKGCFAPCNKKGPPPLGAAAASQIIRHRISENNYDFENF